MPQTWKKRPRCWSRCVWHHRASERHCQSPQNAAGSLHVHSAAACGTAASQRTAHIHRQQTSVCCSNIRQGTAKSWYYCSEFKEETAHTFFLKLSSKYTIFRDSGIFTTFPNLHTFSYFPQLISHYSEKFLTTVPSVLWLPSVLWHCWLGGRKGIRPVKNGGMVEVSTS